MKRRRFNSLIVIIAFLSSLLVVTPAHAAEVENEYNDYFSSANSLELGTKISGSTYSADYSDDDDFYAFETLKAGRVKFDLRFPSNLGAGKAYEVNIYDAHEDYLFEFVIKGSDWNGSRVRNLGTFLPAGLFYIEISGHKNWATWGESYTLQVSLTPGNVEREPNDELATADLLKPKQAISGSSLGWYRWDSDIYAVDIPKGADLVMAFRFPTNLGKGRVYEVSFWDRWGETLGSDYWDGTEAKRTYWFRLPAGRNYIEIEGDSSWPSWGKVYTLTVKYAWAKVPTPTIKGKAKVGKVLKAEPGTWKPKPTSFKYQWYRSGKAIKNATKSSYKVKKADIGKTIKVKVTASKKGFAKTSKKSKATKKVVR